ncbi:MAG: SoxR reducing system RseC family protein [Peptostreptococcus sp.]|uniref:SoxR reducing system RseC family protein n=1 Tax=Peptostreptococcus sp. TaxID=1262 RepID=UPI002FC66BC9
MDQRGYVVDVVDDRTAKFKMQRQSACAKCGKCFGSKSSESQDIIVEVDNELGAKVGDYVEVSMEHVNVMKAIGIAYGIPLIGLLIGTIGSYYILQNVVSGSRLEFYSIGIGLLFTAFAYLGIKLKDASIRNSRKYMPTITRIMIDLSTQKVK